MIPIIVIYESYQPTNLVFQAMAQYRLGMKEKSQQTRRLLAVVMKRPEFKNINTKELDEMLVLPVQKQMLSTPLAE